MSSITIPSEYGYVLGVAVASVLYVFSLSAKVGFARRAANIPYPYMYADKAEAEKDPKKNIFNCTQRAHQNTLEMLPIYGTLMLVGGIKYPEISAGAGVVYILGRVFFTSGYCTGDPAKRTRGGFGYFGLITLLGTATSTVYQLLK